jgi:hypothetical protein
MSSQNHLSDNPGVEEHQPQLQRRSGGHEYPLSLSQQHMWFQCQLDPQSTLFNVGARMAISGPLEVEIFRQALQITVDRHETLQTVFTLSGDTPVQQVMRGVTVQCPIRELPLVRPLDGNEKSWSRMGSLGKIGFDLCAGPLFRGELLRCGERKHYFVFAYHHLILDGFYSGQFMREIASAYDCLRQGEPAPLAPRLQYGDFCIWMRERWDRGDMSRQAAFWQEQLREPLPEFGLPAQRSAPFPRPLRSQLTLPVGKELVTKLRHIGRQCRTTLFRVVVATLGLFFARLGKTNELMFDIDFSTRPREMGRTIGFFANTLPVRFQVHEAQSFCDLLRAVDSQLRQVADNREFPVRQLARKLKARRDPTRPLSAVVVAQLGPLDWRVGELHLTGSMYVTASIHDLWLGVMEREDTLEINVGYSEELFERELIAKWVICVKKLLDQVAASPEESNSQLCELAEIVQGALQPTNRATAEREGINFDEIPNPGDSGHWNV